MSKLSIGQLDAELALYAEEPVAAPADWEPEYEGQRNPALHADGCGCAECVATVAQHEEARAVGALWTSEHGECIDAALFRLYTGRGVHLYPRTCVMYQAVWNYTRAQAEALGSVGLWDWVQVNPWYGKETRTEWTAADAASYARWEAAGSHYYYEGVDAPAREEDPHA